MKHALYRPVCDLLGCAYPIVAAGMGGIARSELVAAVSAAGAFGFLGLVREPVARIRSEVEALRRRGIERFGVNLIPAARGDPFGKARIPIGDDEGRPIYLFSTDSPLRSMTGDFEAMALYAGAGVGRINAVQPAAAKIQAIATQAAGLCASGAAQSLERPEFASPACLAHEMDDGYMGYATRDELLLALNELLEAERAGARVTLRMTQEVPQALKTTIVGLQRDEARWCGVLTKSIQQLQGAPSRKTGAFYEKAMAISDVAERLAFLNRGQGWVVCKLERLLPRVRDDALHADLAAMLKSHQDNIELVTSYSEGGANRGTP